MCVCVCESHTSHIIVFVRLYAMDGSGRIDRDSDLGDDSPMVSLITLYFYNKYFSFYFFSVTLLKLKNCKNEVYSQSFCQFKSGKIISVTRTLEFV